tara:strand:- start:2456 stop:2653 length:198 start_codon:yes stop_codon:yes gene_type:complete
MDNKKFLFIIRNSNTITITPKISPNKYPKNSDRKRSKSLLNIAFNLKRFAKLALMNADNKVKEIK